MKNAFPLMALIVSAATIVLPMAALASSGHAESRDASSDTSSDPWGALRSDFPTDETQPVSGGTADPLTDTVATNNASLPDFDGEPDWSLLVTGDTEQLAKAKLKLARQRAALSADNAWTREAQNNGTSSLSVNRPLTPFWNTKVGADLSVTRVAPVASTSDLLLRQFGTEQTTAQSGGSAWVRMTAPGSNIMWDKAEIEARLDPGSEQNRWSTVFSKSVPVGSDRYALTLQNNFNVIQHGTGLPIGFGGSIFEADQLARISWEDSGTSFIAGQTHSSANDKWLRRIGAEQKVYGNIKLSGSVSETVNGATDKSMFATYQQNW